MRNARRWRAGERPFQNAKPETARQQLDERKLLTALSHKVDFVMSPFRHAVARKIHWKCGLPVITDSVDRPLIWRNGPREFDLPHVHPKLIAVEPVVARGAVDGGD